MAKKKTTDEAAPETVAAEAKTKPEAADPAKKAKAPKEAKEPKAAKEKAAKPSPEAPPREKKPGPAEAAKASPAAPGQNVSVNKKGKRPGLTPARGKKLREKLQAIKDRIAKESPAPLKKAVGLLKQVKRAKFDETVEIHMSLGIDTTQSDQMIRGSVALPFGVGKSVRVLLFTQGDNVGKAKEAGADYAGSDELIQKIQKEGWLEFDVALATQDMMGVVSRLGKVLGPRGLMPTPKAGTVIPAGGDVAAAVREFKAGKVEYRADKGGNVHAGVGKMSFDDDKLVANINTFVNQIRAVKPAGVKGHYIKSITVAGTMTPGVGVSM
jgi:large subunit ribosomal protein L1